MWAAVLACVLAWGLASPPPAQAQAQASIIGELQAQIDALQLQVDANTAAINGIAANTVLDLDGVLTLNGTTALFAGVNVQVLNGMGSSDTANGKGNLIVGYDEAGTAGPDEQATVKTGSHNVVVGPQHTYASFGGIVAGFRNQIAGPHANVTGGFRNRVTGFATSVSGGSGNEATFSAASVSGGNNNTASGTGSSISGGRFGTADTFYASVSGGFGNDATGVDASVSGGTNNTAAGDGSSVAGGNTNTADAFLSSVGGGSVVINGNAQKFAAEGTIVP